MEQYKNSINFEDEVNEAMYDAYYKGFEECKRKVAQAFHLPDLKDIIADELEGTEEGVADAQGDATKVDEMVEPKIDQGPSQEPRLALAAEAIGQTASVRKTVAQAMGKMGAMIDATMEAPKFGGP